ncbi:MAG: hypothetical protein ACRDDL_00410 [Sarcina sp.]
MIVAEYPYIIVMPTLEVIAVEDIEYAKAYINKYYDFKIQEIKKDEKYETEDLNDEEIREEVFMILGNTEGQPVVYDTDTVIEAVRESILFEEEKEEIILELLNGNITFNADILDEILIEVEPVDLFMS